MVPLVCLGKSRTLCKKLSIPCPDHTLVPYHHIPAAKICLLQQKTGIVFTSLAHFIKKLAPNTQAEGTFMWPGAYSCF